MKIDWQEPGLRIKHTAEVLTRALDDELVAYHPRTDDVTRLDPIARTVWEQLTAEPSFPTLIAALAEQFDADAAVVARDVANLLDGLVAAHLISVE